jgi:hypothetical protein
MEEKPMQQNFKESTVDTDTGIMEDLELSPYPQWLI